MSFTNEQIIKAAERAIADRGEEYIYDSHNGELYAYCNSDGTPGCIVGYIVNELDSELFDKLHTKGDGGMGTPFRSSVLNNLIDPVFTIDQRRALDTAQRYQDDGHPWGRAFDRLRCELS